MLRNTTPQELNGQACMQKITTFVNMRSKRTVLYLLLFLTLRFIATGCPSSYSMPASPPSPDRPDILSLISSSSSAMVFRLGLWPESCCVLLVVVFVSSDPRLSWVAPVDDSDLLLPEYLACSVAAVTRQVFDALGVPCLTVARNILPVFYSCVLLQMFFDDEYLVMIWPIPGGWCQLDQSKFCDNYDVSSSQYHHNSMP